MDEANVGISYVNQLSGDVADLKAVTSMKKSKKDALRYLKHRENQ
jgi:hypothetical protein